MRGHIIAVRHQIFPDGKKNGDTDDPDQWASMVNTASTVSMVPTEIMVRAAVNKKTLTTEMSGLF